MVVLRKKINFTPYKIYLNQETVLIVIDHVTLFFTWNNQILENIEWFLSYTEKFIKKWKKKLYNSGFKLETDIAFLFKVWYDNFKTEVQIVLKNQIFVFWTDWEVTRKERFNRMGPSWSRESIL